MPMSELKAWMIVLDDKISEYFDPDRITKRHLKKADIVRVLNTMLDVCKESPPMPSMEQDGETVEAEDIVLDFDKDESCFYEFRCREGKTGMKECFKENESCVGISPRGAFQHCPQLIIIVSADTIKKAGNQQTECSICSQGGDNTPECPECRGTGRTLMDKWHYVCEKGISGECRLKCETFTVETISHTHGCPKSHFGQSANWMNLGLKESPYELIPDDESPPVVTFIHKDCGGEVSFDGFGNWKCKKCSTVSKDSSLIEMKEEEQ